MDTFVQTREKMKKEYEIKTENLALSAFIRYRKLLVPKMGRIDIHQKVTQTLLFEIPLN